MVTGVSYLVMACVLTSLCLICKTGWKEHLPHGAVMRIKHSICEGLRTVLGT